MGLVYLPTSYHKHQPNVGVYTVHGSYGVYKTAQKKMKHKTC